MNGKILWKWPYFVFQAFGWKRQRNMSNSVPFLPTLHITLTSRFTLPPQVSWGASQTTVIYPGTRKLPGADKWHLQYLRTSQDLIASLQVPLAGTFIHFSPPHPLLFYESKPQRRRSPSHYPTAWFSTEPLKGRRECLALLVEGKALVFNFHDPASFVTPVSSFSSSLVLPPPLFLLFFLLFLVDLTACVLSAYPLFLFCSLLSFLLPTLHFLHNFP